MRRTVLLSMLALASVLTPLSAAPKSARKPAPEINDYGITPQTPRQIAFENDDLSLALQVLAHEAKIKLAVSDDLKDTITLRLEKKTPREAIDIIIATKDLAVEDQRGTLYIRAKKNPAPSAPASDTGKTDASAKADSPEAALGNMAAAALVPAMAGIYDAILDYAAKPETAQKVAKATRALYDALIAEGFTKEEAFQIVQSDHGLPFAGSKK